MKHPEDKHGCCLCYPKKPHFELVTNKTREGSGLWSRCSVCGLVVNQSGLTKTELTEYYNGIYETQNSFISGEQVTEREHFELALHSMRPVASHLSKYVQSDWNVLDIGAGTGELLYLLKGLAKNCTGMELNERYCDFMRSEIGVNASSENYASTDLSKCFDLITINGTLDHMPNPLGVIDKVFLDLKPGGLFYIQTANDEQALKDNLPKESSEAFKTFMYQKAHYLSFSQKTLRKAVELAGFEVIDFHSRHDYHVGNFLHWYYTAKPQNSIYQSKIAPLYFHGDDEFTNDLMDLFTKLDRDFKGLMSRYMKGEMLCLTAKKTL